MAITEIIREGKTYRQEWTVKDEHKPDLIRRIKEITNYFNLKPTTTNPDCIHQMKLLEAAFCLKQLTENNIDDYLDIFCIRFSENDTDYVVLTLYEDGDDEIITLQPFCLFNFNETLSTEYE